MQAANRVIINTVILYVKIFVCMFISLWTVPIVLNTLGASDYGLYNLIAGVIALLSFVSASLTVSTQRYLSVSVGKGDAREQNTIYNVSIAIHIVISILIVILFELFQPYLFDGFLNIEADRIDTAVLLYQLMILGVFFTIMSVPADSVLNAKENMLVFSVISIIESVLRLFLAILLRYSPYNLLVTYGAGMALITIVVAAIKYIYITFKYTEIKIAIIKNFDKLCFKDMLFFAGWNTFGAMAGVGRIQGMAIIFNTFLGTIINAAWGIAIQINGVMNYFSATIQKSINPQLMSSYGTGNIPRMVHLSYLLSKYSVLLIAMVSIPLIAEMPYVLRLWLTNVPDNTVMFVRLILVMSIINQCSAGLMSALQAQGNIKLYQLLVGTLVLVNLPIAYLVLHNGYAPYCAVLSAIVIDVIALFARLILVKKQIPEFNTGKFVAGVLLPVLGILAIDGICIYFIKHLMPESIIRIGVISMSSVMVISLFTWYTLIDEREKQTFKGIVNKIRGWKR